MRRRVLALGLVPLAVLAAAAEVERLYGVGRAATDEEVCRRDLTVPPTGAGLPEGGGMARAGRPLYEARCAPCHGAKGEGTDDYPPLAGGQGSLATDKPLLTVGSYWPYATTVFDYNPTGDALRRAGHALGRRGLCRHGIRPAFEWRLG